MDFNIKNDRSTDADVDWYVINLAYSGEISGLLISRMFLHKFFQSNNKKVATNAS